MRRAARSLGQPAIHPEDLARDVARLVGHEEGDRVGNFLRCSHATEGGQLDEAVLHLLRQPARQVGRDEARGDGEPRQT